MLERCLHHLDVLVEVVIRGMQSVTEDVRTWLSATLYPMPYTLSQVYHHTRMSPSPHPSRARYIYIYMYMYMYMYLLCSHQMYSCSSSRSQFVIKRITGRVSL